MFGALASLVLATWSIILTIYYKNSIQKVENLDKVIKALSEQNRLTIENSKPLIKDLAYDFKKIADTKKFEFILDLKNFGGRAGYDLDVKAIFLKLNDERTKIISHGSQSFPKEQRYQEAIFPGETREYKQINNFSENGYNDLNTILLALKLVYVDKATNSYETVYYFYSHQFNISNKQIISSTANEKEEKLAIQYINENRL
jgi:hypothetical protein